MTKTNYKIKNYRKDTFTILITECSKVMAHSIIKGFRNVKSAKIKIIATDSISDSIGRYIGDTFYEIPRPSDGDNQYIKSLIDICIKEKVSMIIPAHDIGLLELSKNKQRFIDVGCFPLVSDQKVIEMFSDKYKTYTFFNSIGIDTPKSFYVEDVLEGRADIEFPAFLKPSNGVFSFHTFEVKNKEELGVLSKTIPKMFGKPIIQQLLSGREFSVDVLMDFNGSVLDMVGRSRDERKQGESTRGTSIYEPELLRLAKIIGERSNIIGPFNIQCIKNTDGKYYFFEINPRFSGNHVHTIVSGLNTPEILLKLLKGEKINHFSGKSKKNIRFYRYQAEIFIDEKGKIIKELPLL